MKELGIKVVKLNLRVRKLENKLGLPQIVFPQRFSSGYHNTLINTVQQLFIKVVRLERKLGLTPFISGTTGHAMLKNVALKINVLCQRIVRIERLI